MKKAKQQMGVQVFMMIGYKNKKGEILRAKWVLFYIPFDSSLTFNTSEQIGNAQVSLHITLFLAHLQSHW